MTSDQIRAWRKRLGLSQVRAAERLGISPRQIQNYESGHSPVPRTVELACAAIAQGIEPHPN